MTELATLLAGAGDAESRAGPVYQHIADAIADGVTSGRLTPGERLPTHRALAHDLGVAVATVSRAYREAEGRGLVESTVGRGTFVAGIPTLRETAAPGRSGRPVLDLSVNAPARGDHERLLRETLSAAAADVELASLLGYEADVGRQVDREAAAAWLARSGVDVEPQQVAICHGGQHAILVAIGAAMRSGDVLLTESLTYPGVKAAAQVLGVEVVGVEMDHEGLVPEALEAACAAGVAPRALYCTPTAHNPTATTLTSARREAIADIAGRHDLLIVEDDVFGLLAPERDRPTPLVELAPERTLHLTSLSKTLFPGLRWGAIAVPPRFTDRVGALIRSTIFNPAPIALDIARRWLADGTAVRLQSWQRVEMARRFADTEEVLGRCAAVRTVRTAGLHAWVELQDPWTPAEVIDVARRLDVEIGATSFFYADSSSSARGVRLCLGNAPDHASLSDALARLAAALEQGPSYTSGTRI